MIRKSEIYLTHARYQQDCNYLQSLTLIKVVGSGAYRAGNIAQNASSSTSDVLIKSPTYSHRSGFLCALPDP